MLYSVVVGLWFLVSVSRGDVVCKESGQQVSSNEGVNNYYIDTLQYKGFGIPFAYAMNQCTAHSVDAKNNVYYMHSCNNDGTMTTQIFTDPSCAKSSFQSSTVSKLASTYPVGEAGYFECGGDDTFAMLYLSLSENNGCNNLQTIYAGLGACVDASDDFDLAYSVYCQTSESIFEFFTSTGNRRLASLTTTTMTDDTTTTALMTNDMTTTTDYIPNGMTTTTDYIPMTTTTDYIPNGMTTTGMSATSMSTTSMSATSMSTTSMSSTSMSSTSMSSTSMSTSTMTPGSFDGTCDKNNFCQSVTLSGSDCVVIGVSKQTSFGLYGKTGVCTATSTSTKAAIRTSTFFLSIVIALVVSALAL